MEYDAAAVRQMGIDPRSWRWFGSSYEKYLVPAHNPVFDGLEMREVTGIRPALFSVFIISLALYLGIFIYGSVLAGQPLSVLSCLFFLGIGVLCHARSTFPKVLGYIALALFIVLALPAWGIVRLYKKSTYRTGKLTKRTTKTASSIPQQRIFGCPGGIASAARKYGDKAVEAGAKGEQDTAILLSLLLKIPGTTIYHGLRFPDSSDADVDHAVAHGNTVYLIDSKKWRWGEYEWKSGIHGEEIVRTDGYGRGRKNHMDAAAEGYQKMLGPGVRVIPVLMMHGRKVSVGTNYVSNKGVLMLTANDVMRHMGDYMCDRMPQWQDNQNVRDTLIKNLKP